MRLRRCRWLRLDSHRQTVRPRAEAGRRGRRPAYRLRILRGWAIGTANNTHLLASRRARIRSNRRSSSSGRSPVADVTMYYIDIRAFGKGYDELYEQTKDMGVGFGEGEGGEMREKEDGNLVLRYEDIDGGGAIARPQHDLVVLSVGIARNLEFDAPLRRTALEPDGHALRAGAGRAHDPRRRASRGSSPPARRRARRWISRPRFSTPARRRPRPRPYRGPQEEAMTEKEKR